MKTWPAIDEYKHLDETDKVEFPAISIPDMVDKMVMMNYGGVRVASALVHALREKYEQSLLADAIEEALTKSRY